MSKIVFESVCVCVFHRVAVSFDRKESVLKTTTKMKNKTLPKQHTNSNHEPIHPMWVFHKFACVYVNLSVRMP